MVGFPWFDLHPAPHHGVTGSRRFRSEVIMPADQWSRRRSALNAGSPNADRPLSRLLAPPSTCGAGCPRRAAQFWLGSLLSLAKSVRRLATIRQSFVLARHETKVSTAREGPPQIWGRGWTRASPARKVASGKRDNRQYAPVGAPPTPRSGWTRKEKENPRRRHAPREREVLRGASRGAGCLTS